MQQQAVIRRDAYGNTVSRKDSNHEINFNQNVWNKMPKEIYRFLLEEGSLPIPETDFERRRLEALLSTHLYKRNQSLREKEGYLVIAPKRKIRKRRASSKKRKRAGKDVRVECKVAKKDKMFFDKNALKKIGDKPVQIIDGGKVVIAMDESKNAHVIAEVENK